jgi:NAD(P)-dependent dehydrogenase (short-subunit alcohol dehydrogenase family)
MSDIMNLKGKRILVTGASSGIGRAASILISQLGGQVILVGRNEQRLQETYHQLDGTGHLAISFDLCVFDKYSELFREILSEGDKLSGFVHCAGVAKVIPIRVVSYKAIMSTMEINYVSFMELVKYYCKGKISCGGSIVAVSAINAHYPQKCMSVYAASKGAVEMAVSSLAVELYEKDIRINTVVPGPIKTPMSAKFNEIAEGEENIVGRQLMSMGEPEDVANMIVYLLSDMSKFITGRNFFVDGGRL